MAASAGFDNINLDLMFGLPGQSLQDAIDDVRIACELQPSHISHYQLTIEPNTLFYTQTPVLPSADPLWEMQIRCHEDAGESTTTYDTKSRPSRNRADNVGTT